ncbi:MAG: hypothetical protein JWL66_1024 [Sphingomonadales bacterium]|nr:hypothetical protein [Sphingomonadales bacterium]
MTEAFETAGDLVTGAIVGRAVEPGHGESGAGDWGAPVHGACLNCGAALNGSFCSACGQNAHVHRTLTALGHDIGHGVFHFEGKVWRTLPMLALHPGVLTRRYIDGERARFVSPMALFLFSVFLLFAVIHNLVGEIDVPDNPTGTNRQTVAALDANVAKIDAKLAAVLAQQAVTPTPEIAKQIDALQKAEAGVKATRSAFQDDTDPEKFVENVKTGWKRLDNGVQKAAKNPGLMIYKLQTSAYKYSWALIPISVPFVALLFLWRPQFKLYDHAIFVTYSLAFMVLFVVVLTIAGAVGIADGFIVVTALTVPIVHMFAQLRAAYGLTKPSALWRTAALTVFSFVALTTFTVLLLAMGLMD